MLAFLAILKNRYVQYGLIVVALVIGYSIMRQHFINQGKEQGQQETEQRAADALEEARKADRAKTAEILNANATEMKYQRELSEAAQLAFMQLATQRQTATAQIASMTASQVEDAINRALGKKPGEQETEQDRRTIANCLVQLPFCEKQVAAKQDEVNAKAKELEKSQSSLDTLTGYTVRLEQTYTNLWNLKAEKKRSVKCMFLWKCSRPHINAPNPDELKRTRPQ
jgi:hypothetical protein